MKTTNVSRARWEIEDTALGFRHRVVVGGKIGRWRRYERLASVEADGRLFIGGTAYWTGTLPIECVLEVRRVLSGRTKNKLGSAASLLP